MTTQSGGNEKELVLGNKQLLAVFFVGTALCAVFFAMGYMVGRNSAKNALATTDPAATAPITDSAHRQQPEPPRETAADPNAQQPAPTDQPAAVETKPMQDTQPPAAVPAPAPALVKEPAAETKATHASVTTPEAGAQYLQVAALPRPDAENMLHTLREQNLPAILASSPKEGYTRVLVGPYHQAIQLAEAKSKLKSLGFAGAYVQHQ